MWYKRVKFEKKEVPFTLNHEWEEGERERFVLIWFEPLRQDRKSITIME